MRLIFWFVLVAFSAATSEAVGCGSGANVRAYIHTELPSPLPVGAFVAEVEFDPTDLNDPDPDFVGKGHRAKIVRHVQGDFSGWSIIARRNLWTSCDSVFANGLRGWVIGRELGLEGDSLVINPVMVSTFEGYRVPDAFELRPATETAPPEPVSQK